MTRCPIPSPDPLVPRWMWALIAVVAGMVAAIVVVGVAT